MAEEQNAVERYQQLPHYQGDEESVLVPAKVPEHETVCERDERSQEMRHKNDVLRMATTGDLAPTPQTTQ